MKVAVFGRTLYAGVMAALLAECGHTVYWCDIFQQDRPEVTDFQDEAVNRLLQQQHALGFLQYCSLNELGLDIDVYLFSLNPPEKPLGLELLQQLQQRPLIHPKLMVNASTLGLQGTAGLERLLPEDDGKISVISLSRSHFCFCSNVVSSSKLRSK